MQPRLTIQGNPLVATSFPVTSTTVVSTLVVTNIVMEIQNFPQKNLNSILLSFAGMSGILLPDYLGLQFGSTVLGCLEIELRNKEVSRQFTKNFPSSNSNKKAVLSRNRYFQEILLFSNDGCLFFEIFLYFEDICFEFWKKF